MRAISIRQPFAEMVIRGIKSIEVRSRHSSIQERVYVYAGNKLASADIQKWAAKSYDIICAELPRGRIVGTVELMGSRALRRADSRAAGFKIDRVRGRYAWILAKPVRARRLLRPRKHPQPVWFDPF